MHTPEELHAHGVAFIRKMSVAETLEDTYWPVPLPAKLASGKWRIEQFTLEDPLPMSVTIKNIQYLANDTPECVVSAGTYHRLVGPCGDDGTDGVMMSNTQLEYRTNIDFVNRAHGHVLIAGLGLGMLIGPLMAKPDVQSITIVELEQDVIDMVAPIYRTLYGSCLHIHHNDAKNYVPDQSFDAIMLDIWPDISGGNLDEMGDMECYYADFLNPGGHIECWSEPLARRMDARMDAMLDALRGARTRRSSAA